MKPSLLRWSAVAAAFCCSAASAQKFPDRPIHLVVPFPAGGSADLLPRMLTERASAELGVPVIVENRTGAGGNIGAAYVGRAEPDGYTLLVAPVGFFFSHLLYKDLTFDPSKFVGVTIMAAYPSVLMASPKLPANTVKEVLALAKERKGKLTYASAGAGTNQHLSAEMLESYAKVDMTHVPYRGTGAAMSDLVSGSVDLVFDNVISAAPVIQGGRLKLLAVTGTSRLPAFPDTPTVAETVPGYDSQTWMGIVAPPGTPAAVVAKLNAAFVAALAEPAVAQRIRAWNAQVVGNTPQEMAEVIKRDVARWTQVIRAANIQPE